MSLAISEDEKIVNHRKKREWRQIQILKDIAINGPQSITSLVIIQGVNNRNDITSPWNVLKDLKFLEYDHEVKGAGSPQNFYKLSKLGMEFLSKEQSLKPEEFWRIAFQVYEKQVFKTKLPLEIFFSNYEKCVLGYDPEFTLVNQTMSLENLLFSYGLGNYPRVGVSILILLATKKPMSEKDIVKYLKKENPLKIKINESAIDSFCKGLEQSNLILAIRNDNVLKYRLTIYGFLFIMKFLYKSSQEIFDNPKIDEEVMIKNIIKNSQVNLPYLSEKWYVLRKIVKEDNVIDIFRNILEKTIISGPIQTGGVEDLLNTERIMMESFTKIVKDEFKTGLDVLIDLIKKEGFKEGFDSPVRKRLLFLQIISGVSLKGKENIIADVKGKEFSIDDESEKVISNKIAFEFFTYFLDKVIQEKELADNSRNPDDADRHYSKVQEWNKFQKSNKGFREWFESWIEQLAEFEERNVKVFKERPFLNV